MRLGIMLGTDGSNCDTWKTRCMNFIVSGSQRVKETVPA